MANDVTALAVSAASGSIRLYWKVDLTTMKWDPSWTTYLNLRNPKWKDNIVGQANLATVDMCCPKVRFRQEIPCAKLSDATSTLYSSQCVV